MKKGLITIAILFTFSVAFATGDDDNSDDREVGECPKLPHVCAPTLDCSRCNVCPPATECPPTTECPHIGEISKVCETICNEVADSCVDAVKCPKTAAEECASRNGKFKDNGFNFKCVGVPKGMGGSACTVAGLQQYVNKCFGSECEKNPGLADKARDWFNGCPR